MVLIVVFDLINARYLNQFPSPYGDYGSYLALIVRLMISATGLFPSPYGDYGSYQ